MNGHNDLDIAGWVEALCHAASTRPADIATALGIDIVATTRIGSQLICPPMPGAESLELVLDPESGAVRFIEVGLAPPAPVLWLSATLGPPRAAPPGPHASYPTLLFDQTWPPRAPRACSVVARLGPPPRTDDRTRTEAHIRVVTLHLEVAPT